MENSVYKIMELMLIQHRCSQCLGRGFVLLDTICTGCNGYGMYMAFHKQFVNRLLVLAGTEIIYNKKYYE